MRYDCSGGAAPASSAPAVGSELAAEHNSDEEVGQASIQVFKGGHNDEASLTGHLGLACGPLSLVSTTLHISLLTKSAMHPMLHIVHVAQNNAVAKSREATRHMQSLN